MMFLPRSLEIPTHKRTHTRTHKERVVLLVRGAYRLAQRNNFGDEDGKLTYLGGGAHLELDSSRRARLASSPVLITSFYTEWRHSH